MSATNNHPELITQLADGIASLTTSDKWQRYLDCQSRFHSYSFGNVLLIAAQRHECAFRANRPAVPAETGHPFRGKPAGGGEVWCHVYSVVGGDVAGVPGDVLVEE